MASTFTKFLTGRTTKVNAALDYCGGLFDGEGYVGIKRRYSKSAKDYRSYYVAIQLEMCDEAIIQHFALIVSTLLPGLSFNIRRCKARKAKWNASYVFETNSNSAYRICKLLVKHLRTSKKQQAEECIAYQEWHSRLSSKGKRRAATYTRCAGYHDRVRNLKGRK